MRVFFVIVLFKVHNSVGIVLEGDWNNMVKERVFLPWEDPQNILLIIYGDQVYKGQKSCPWLLS